MATPTSSLEDTAFQSAVDDFKTRCGLNRAELQSLGITTLTDLQQAIFRIQSQQKASKTLKFVKRVKPFLDAMQQYGEVVGVFVNTCNMLAYVWGPMKFLLNTVSNFSEAFNALLDGYHKIGRRIPVLIQYQGILKNNPILQDALVHIFEDILEFHFEAIKYFRQKAWKTYFKATWNQVSKKITQLSQNLDEQRHFFESALNCSQYKELHELRGELQHGLYKLEIQRQQARDEFDARTRKENMERRAEVLHWLGALNSDSDARHQDAFNRLHPGTGQWLLRNTKFQNWYPLNRCSDPLLWLSGQPGAGKTILSSFIIDKIKQFQNATTVFFYCKYGDDTRMRFLAVIKALLSQILMQNNELLPVFYEKRARSDPTILSDIRLAKELLEIALKAKKNTYVIIDGLDEYSRDERKEITTWFLQTINSIPTNELGALRCLFVSQEDGFAKKDFSILSHVQITAADNEEDIRSYVQVKHREIEEKFGQLGNKYNITDAITARSQGMFLYARLVLSNLLEQSTIHDMEREMDPRNLPEGFEQAYGRIIERLLDSRHTRQRNILKLLGWLACAKRPLKWYEIQAAWSFDIDEGTWDLRRRFVEDGKDLCASLVEICWDGTVVLVHSTAREFLIQQHHIQLAETDIELANLCLAYLNLEDFADEASDEQITQSILEGTYAFFDYAVSFWGLHIETGLSRMSANKSNFNQNLEIEPLLENLDSFLDCHWSADESLEALSVPVPDTLRTTLSPLQGLEMHKEALQCISAMRHALRLKGKNSPLEDMLSIYDVLQRGRGILESMVSRPEAQTTLKERYGSAWFKCSRLNCRFFYHGFETDSLRQRHRERHERSYVCWTEGCFQAINGYATAKDLEKHMCEVHGIVKEDDKDEFPPEEKPDNPFRGKLRCPKCPRRYRSEKGLDKHLRTSRCSERLHNCDVCGKGFKRIQEMKRHETSHQDEKNFFCGDKPLRSGEAWGCGKRFRRADALKKHFRTEAGRACIKPYLREQNIQETSD